jgi:uncharacterized protein (DUF885 family)
VHDYDQMLPDHSPDGMKQRVTWLRDLEQRLVASVPWQELPTEQRVEFGLLRSKLAALRADCEEMRVHTRNPVIFPEVALNAVHLLVARPFAPLAERKEAILARLTAIPDYLDAAKANLIQVPNEFLAVADEVTGSGPGFVDYVQRMLIEAFPAEAERIEQAAKRARVGFARYASFLQNDLDSKVGGTFAIGERWMNYKLEREHLLGMDCKALDALGREHVARAHAGLEAEARTIDPTKTWRDLIAEAKTRHPEALKLREAYAAETERARRFTHEKRLAPILGDAKLEVVDTPVFERHTTPYAAYLPPGPFDDDQTGYFYVTPVDPARRPNEQAEQLQGHNYAGIPLTTVHEAFPGHHLQLCHANRASSRLRRLADSNLFCEGWALYCEELMLDQGYYLDAYTRLHQLKDVLLRACRVVLDVALHTGTMSFMKGVDYLMDQAMVERVNAIAEVRRYALMPTQPMSYLVGKLEILSLRDEAKKRLGPRFDLYEFHAALLAGGTLPPALVREEIWERLK